MFRTVFKGGIKIAVRKRRRRPTAVGTEEGLAITTQFIWDLGFGIWDFRSSFIGFYSSSPFTLPSPHPELFEYRCITSQTHITIIIN